MLTVATFSYLAQSYMHLVVQIGGSLLFTSTENVDSVESGLVDIFSAQYSNVIMSKLLFLSRSVDNFRIFLCFQLKVLHIAPLHFITLWYVTN